jgi:hypothetical protein
MRWIALVLLCAAGCSSTRARITVTRQHGEPVISVEFYDGGVEEARRWSAGEL